jgi:DNA topoisomerase-1
MTMSLDASLEASEFAEAAGLTYVNDTDPGITRVAKGEAFAYFDASGKPVTDAATLDRIAGLVLPPAWSEVWISADPDGHVQATARDQRGRKQY